MKKNRYYYFLYMQFFILILHDQLKGRGYCSHSQTTIITHEIPHYNTYKRDSVDGVISLILLSGLIIWGCIDYYYNQDLHSVEKFYEHEINEQMIAYKYSKLDAIYEVSKLIINSSQFSSRQKDHIRKKFKIDIENYHREQRKKEVEVTYKQNNNYYY